MKRTIVILLTMVTLLSCVFSIPANAETTDVKQDISDSGIVGLNPSYEYTGKAIKPTFNILSDFTETTDNGDGTVSATTYFVILDSEKDCSVTYKHNKEIGIATATITGIGNYKGTISDTFKILPKSIKIKNISSKKKQLTVTASKAKGGCFYQFAYRKTGNKKWSYTNSKTPKKNIKHLKSGKSYQIKVRAFKKVNGRKFNGQWSSLRKKTVK